jgi:hypothetical protein
VFFLKFLFWALYRVPGDLHRRKPAYLELFGLRIRMGGGVNYMGGILVGIAGLFLDPGFTSVKSPYYPQPFSTILPTNGLLDRLLMIPFLKIQKMSRHSLYFPYPCPDDTPLKY